MTKRLGPRVLFTCAALAAFAAALPAGAQSPPAPNPTASAQPAAAVYPVDPSEAAEWARERREAERARERAEEAAQRWEPGKPIPDGYHRVKGRRTSLAVAGGAAFTCLYALHVFGALAARQHGDERHDPMFIPVLGPFVTIDTARTDRWGTFGLIVDGLAQTSTVVLFVAGMVGTQVKLEKDAPIATIEAAPFVSADARSAGLGLSGSFSPEPARPRSDTSSVSPASTRRR